ncbi:6,7-dimethyl-8-ribityllumazine synthase [candidate division KSB1 bacterium]|nr:6,7-dimethyl-8-ribityllumazine synthase [candidate division KSB1 bacterium]
MSAELKGRLKAEGWKFGIVVSRFNEFIAKEMLAGALDCLGRHGGQEENIQIAWVPGSFEIPMVAKRMALTGRYDAVICLGAIIRGGTPHFEYIASQVTRGIAQVGLETDVPTIYGVITTDDLEQAIERAGTKAGNKGWNAAESAMEMVDLFKQMEK